MESNFRKLIKLIAAVAAMMVCAAAVPESQVQKTIHEAENLSLEKDRISACQILWRAFKKATNKEEAKSIKDKLIQLSRYFYTDKGFQSYLAGKELFEKQKYSDAFDKLTEADELENSNVDVLHYLTLTNLWLKRTEAAEATSKRALQVCPLDIELLRDSLAVQREEGLWAEVIKTAENLSKNFGDTSATTEVDWAMAILKTDGPRDAAKKHLEAAVQRDPKMPGAYFWLAQTEALGAADAEKSDPAQRGREAKFLTKYVDLCENTPKSPYPRESGYCAHLQEAKKRITP